MIRQIAYLTELNYVAVSKECKKVCVVCGTKVGCGCKLDENCKCAKCR